MVVNRQTKVGIDTAHVRALVRRLSAALQLKRRCFNVCFVDDNKIQRLNAEFRGKAKPTDVLSFPWKDGRSCEVRVALRREGAESRSRDPLAAFLGDIVISAETAQRNAASAGHSTLNEIRWLILHGVLHLLGYDHSTDDGEMTTLELCLRDRLGIDGVEGKSKSKEQKAKMKKPRRKGRHSSAATTP